MPATVAFPRLPVDEMFDDVTRRGFVIGTTAFLLSAAACGSDDDSTTPSNDITGGGTRQVVHRYGTTEVPASPVRVLTVGLVDHDAVLALGFTPIAVTADEYSSEQPFGVWPWAQKFLGDAEPAVLPFELNFERIAELKPDLILAIYAGVTEVDYGLLSDIAPTVAQSADHGDYQTPWDVMTRAIGDALGARQRAEELISEVEAAFAAARRDHPEFEGKLAVYAGSTANGREQVALFDRDVLVWEIGDVESRAAIEADPLYSTLPVHQEGRDVFVTDPTLAGSLALVSVLSLRHAIQALVPLLAAAVDGDPATPVPRS